jgi:predicted metal-dependent hydrolase
LLFGERITLHAANVKAYSFDGKSLFCRFASLRRQLTAFYTDRMKELTEPLLRQWCRKMNLDEVLLRFRAMTSRFGSCHPRKRIVTLNLRLAFYDPSYLEYVLIHELVHFYHPNHSPAFYTTLLLYLPDWKKRKNALENLVRQYSLPDPFAK